MENSNDSRRNFEAAKQCIVSADKDKAIELIKQAIAEGVHPLIY